MIYIIYLLSAIISLFTCYLIKKYNKIKRVIYYSYHTALYLAFPTMICFILHYHLPASILFAFLSSFLWFIMLICIVLIVLLIDIDEYKNTK